MEIRPAKNLDFINLDSTLLHQSWELIKTGGFLVIFGQLPIQPATDWNAKKTCPSSLKIPSFVADNQVISPNLQPTVDEKNHHVDHVEYPLVNKQKAIEHGPFSSWIYPLYNSMVIFP